MHSPSLLVLLIVGFFGALYLIARWGRCRTDRCGTLFNNGWLYAFSLAVYCTSWTYYGSVGNAATSGPLFLTIYLGPTLGALFWHLVLRKMIRISRLVRVTSIADFIAARYANSPVIAATVTVMVLVGILPYTALQHKAVKTSFTLLAGDKLDAHPWVGDHLGLAVAAILVAFTILTGARTLRSTKSSDGLMAAVATGSMVKLGSFVCVGAFVTFGLFGGFDDLMSRLPQAPELSSLRAAHVPASKWLSYLLLSMCAFLLLPHQFHMAVVENRDPRHLKTATWLVPLYLLAMNIFVLPIAISGLLKGLPPDQADSFVLRLPSEFGPSWLTLLVFIGGFAAATSMIMVSSLSMATMATNHLLLPLASSQTWLRRLRRHILQLRWIAIAGVNLLGYWYAKTVGDSYTLVNMGMISFAAVLQFAPTVLVGMFWRGASRVGAMAGLGGGFAVWMYTLLLPSFAKSGWLSSDWLQHGPSGIEALRPEQLFGMTQLDPISHAVLWSLGVNITLLIVGSLVRPPHDREVHQVNLFVAALDHQSDLELSTPPEANIPLQQKLSILEQTLREYFSADEARHILDACRRESGIELSDDPDRLISITELTRLVRSVEYALGEAVGSSAAGYLLRRSGVYAGAEFKQLTRLYADLLVNLQLSPEELTRRIDYYQEKERLQQQQAEELEGQIHRRTQELEQTLEQLKTAQDSMIQSEKMASIGMLAAGVAHEINNPVGYISSNLNTLSEYAAELQTALDLDSDEVKQALGDSEQARQFLATLRKLQQANDIPLILEDLPQLVAESVEGTERIRIIVSDLKVFSHNEGHEQREEDLHNVIDRALNLAHNELKYNCTVVKDYGDLPPVVCQGNRLGQVFLNLFVNASHAIATEGTITVATGCVDDRVWITITDTGSGIDPAYLNKIFDPFFTTKDVGKGTGLGLHLSYNIICAHEGQILVSSEPGQGTTFRIELPVNGVTPPDVDYDLYDDVDEAEATSDATSETTLHEMPVHEI